MVHEAACEFRWARCPEPGCQRMLPSLVMAAHVGSHHGLVHDQPALFPLMPGIYCVRAYANLFYIILKIADPPSVPAASLDLNVQVQAYFDSGSDGRVFMLIRSL